MKISIQLERTMLPCSYHVRKTNLIKIGNFENIVPEILCNARIRVLVRNWMWVRVVVYAALKGLNITRESHQIFTTAFRSVLIKVNGVDLLSIITAKDGAGISWRFAREIFAVRWVLRADRSVASSSGTLWKIQFGNCLLRI